MLVEKIIGKSSNYKKILYGFILFFSTNQIILTPCAIFHVSFKICSISCIIVDILLIIISFVVCKKRKNKIEIKKYFLKMKRTEKIITFLMIGIIIFQVLFSIITFYENADDSYYIGLTMSSIDSENVYMEEPSMGYEATENSLMTPIEHIPNYELHVAVLCKAFNINPAVMYHTLLQIIFIIISYMSYYYLARVFLNKKYSKLFVILLSIIMMFAAFSTKFRTGCLLCKTWQGKSIFLNIVLNIIIASLMKLDKKIRKSDTIILMLANIAAIHFSSTAIFLLPFVYVPFGIFKLLKLKIKDLLCLILTSVPLLIYILIMIILIKTAPKILELPSNHVSLIECLNFYGSKVYLIYYIISIIIIAIFGNKKARKYFILVQIINLFTIWNPLFSDFIAINLTSSATFWRVFWLLPIEITIAYAIIRIIGKMPNLPIKIIVFIISIAVIIIPGKFVYKFKLIENFEKIPQSVINQAEYILKEDKEKNKITVLGPPEPLTSSTIRQLTSKIKLIFSRDMYMGKIQKPEIEKERFDLEHIYFVDIPEYSG